MYKKKKFWGVVVIPTILVALYFLLFATPVYRSQTTLMVTNPAKESGGMAEALSGSSGDSSTGAYMVKSFTESWGEYHTLNARFDLRRVWHRGDVVSSYTRVFPSDVAQYRYFKSHVTADIDKHSSILTLSTYAYSSHDAHMLSAQLLQDAEERINLINRRKDVDMNRNALRQFNDLQQAVMMDSAAINQFRLKTGYFKPDLDYTATLNTQTNIQSSIAKAKADFTASGAVIPGNPSTQGLKVQMDSYAADSAKLNHERGKIRNIAEAYGELEAKLQLDTTMLEKAGTLVQETETKASGDHYYLNVLSDPSQPETAEFPRAILWTGITFGLLLLLYVIIL